MPSTVQDSEITAVEKKKKDKIPSGGLNSKGRRKGGNRGDGGG